MILLSVPPRRHREECRNRLFKLAEIVVIPVGLFLIEFTWNAGAGPRGPQRPPETRPKCAGSKKINQNVDQTHYDQRNDHYWAARAVPKVTITNHDVQRKQHGHCQDPSRVHKTTYENGNRRNIVNLYNDYRHKTTALPSHYLHSIGEWVGNGYLDFLCTKPHPSSLKYE